MRLALAGAVGLSVDEAYSVAISRHWALSYFDHPPLHVWLVGAWARLSGSERPLLLRLPDIVMFAVSTWLMYQVTTSAYGKRAGLWAALALNLAPVFTLDVAGGILPDGPLVLLSLLAAWYFQSALLAGSAAGERRGRVLAAGACAGAALLSKYTAAFPILGSGVYLVTARPRWLKEPAPWLAAALVVIAFTPVLFWNHEHAWASFAFQGGRALPTHFSPSRAAAAFAGQLLYLLPWTALAALGALAGALRRGASDEISWLFACLAAPAILAFSLVALWAPVLPHWPAIGWLFALPLLGRELTGFERRRPRLLRGIAAASATVLFVLVALFALQATTGLVGRAVPALAAHDPTLDLLDWRELRPIVQKLRQRRPDLVIATVSWIDAGKVAYALGREVPVLCLSDDARAFGFLDDPQRYRGRDALVIADGARPDWLRRAAPYFARLEPAADVRVLRAGEPALTLRTAYAFGLVSTRPTHR
jgi:4-amino-4-deoxy-L-arabinose transferase-like glycosyltransferase